MKTLLFLLILAGAGYVVLYRPDIVDKIKVHLAAIQRHAQDIAKEQAAATASEGPEESKSADQSAVLYTTTRITEMTDRGVMSIPQGTQVRIVEMSGDNVTITDGNNTVQTTPDFLSDTAPPATPVNEVAQTAVQTAPRPDTVSAAEAVAARNAEIKSTADQQHNAKIQAYISSIDQQISHLQEQIRIAQDREFWARLRRNSSAHGVTIGRHNREIERLQLQKQNFLRQLR